MDREFAGKDVLITGSTSGIGEPVLLGLRRPELRWQPSVETKRHSRRLSGEDELATS